MGVRDWMRTRAQKFLGIAPPPARDHAFVGGIALGSVVRTPEEAAALNYTQTQPLRHVFLPVGQLHWECPAHHRNTAKGTGYANCSHCCWPVHIDYQKESINESN